jgi:hypothetical protein
MLEGKNRYPLVSTVLYLGEEGGPTLVLNQTEDEANQPEQGDNSKGSQHLPEIPDFAFLVHPQSNRHIQFDGRLYHGVVGQLARQHSPQMATARTRTRYTLLVNWWVDKPKTVDRLDLRLVPNGSDGPYTKQPMEVSGEGQAVKEVQVMGGRVGLDLNDESTAATWPVAIQHEIVELVGRANSAILGEPVTELMLLPVPVHLDDAKEGDAYRHTPHSRLERSAVAGETAVAVDTVGGDSRVNNGVYAINWQRTRDQKAPVKVRSDVMSGEWHASRGVVAMDMSAATMSALLQPNPLPRALVFVDGSNITAGGYYTLHTE